MNVIMARPNSSSATLARRKFLGSLQWNPGQVIEPDFDEVNDRYPPTVEPLDWHQSQKWPALQLT